MIPKRCGRRRSRRLRSSCKVPTTLLVKPAVAEDLAKRLPNARLVVVPIGSHMLPLTDPDQVVRRIQEFLTQ